MSDIEWCDETWNPVVGCSRVSAGCDNCYAIGVAHRKMQPAHEGLTKLRPKTASRPGVDWNGVVRCLPERLETPLHWRRARRVFVNSMSDLFHESVPFEFIAAVFKIMAMCPQHTFQVLTKRDPRPFFEWASKRIPYFTEHGAEWPLPNVWLGASIESADYLWRVDDLERMPAALRFVSLEPLLGPIDGIVNPPPGAWRTPPGCDEPVFDSSPGPIDWVIVGGESGAGARPCRVDWIRSIVRQCREADVPVFVKQLGRVVIDEIVGDGEPWPDGTEIYEEDTPAGARIKLRDRKGKEMAEWPPDLRVRQFPADAFRGQGEV